MHTSTRCFALFAVLTALWGSYAAARAQASMVARSTTIESPVMPTKRGSPVANIPRSRAASAPRLKVNRPSSTVTSWVSTRRGSLASSVS